MLQKISWTLEKNQNFFEKLVFFRTLIRIFLAAISLWTIFRVSVKYCNPRAVWWDHFVTVYTLMLHLFLPIQSISELSISFIASTHVKVRKNIWFLMILFWNFPKKNSKNFQCFSNSAKCSLESKETNSSFMQCWFSRPTIIIASPIKSRSLLHPLVEFENNL